MKEKKDRTSSAARYSSISGLNMDFLIISSPLIAFGNEANNFRI